MSEYIIELPNGGAADECIRLRGYEKSLYGYELREEIVRCRDCKHSYLFDMSWKSPKTNDIRYCSYGTYLQYEVPDDGFCKWGERRDA